MKKTRNPVASFLYSQKAAPYVFIAPFVVLFLLFFLYPIISTVIMSFQKVLPGQVEFVGLANFRNLMNGDFVKAVSNSLTYTVFTLLLLIPFPMLFAVFLNSKRMPLKNTFRSVFFIPALTSIVVAGFSFRLIFGEMSTATVNHFLSLFGADPIKWVGGSSWSTFFVLLVISCWRWTGVNIMYFLSGLQSIPQELYESASVDGANVAQKFFRITVPMLKPTTIYVLTISIFGGLAMFLESYMLFNGNRSPGNVGLTIVGYLYRQGWEQNNIGFGCAVGLAMLVATLIINLIQLRLTGFFRKEG